MISNLTTESKRNLKNIQKYNIILGRNGSGKSVLLRDIGVTLATKQASETGISKFQYITPERSGSLKYNAGQEQNMQENPNYLRGQRGKNQADQFKQ